jgi:hypothetical protein
MDLETDVEIGFAVWLSTNYEPAKLLYDNDRITWELLVELLRRSFTAGVGHGMLSVVERLDELELERKRKNDGA